MRPLEVEPRGRDGGLRGLHGGGAALGGAGAVVELLLRDRVAGGQHLRSVQAARGQRGGAARLREVGLGARQLGLVGARIDLEQHVPLAHLFARGEDHALDVAGDARSDLDGVDGLEAADELVPFGDLALLDGGDADGGRRRRHLRLGLRAAAAARDQRHGAAQRRAGEEKVSRSFHFMLHLFGRRSVAASSQRRALRSAMSGPAS